MMAEYLRPSTDFTSANNGVDNRLLQDTVWISETITTLFMGIQANTDDISGDVTYTFLFNAEISAAEETELDIVIAAHVGKPAPSSALDVAIVEAHRNIDTAASDARARYITDGVGQSATYLAKEENARKFKDDAYPEGSLDLYKWVKAEKNATGAANGQAAADIIILKADGWVDKGAAIEELRIKYKQDCSVETDADVIMALACKAVALLDAE